MSKRILIIGASILQLPAILRAKALGMYVGVADFNPKAVGIPYADEYFNVSTIDIDGVTEAARQFKPDGIMTLATDMPMRSIAGATKALGLPGISMETAIKATDKAAMIQAFKNNDVEHPWFYIVDNLAAFESVKGEITYPCIVKPTDNSGSRGVVLVQSESELLEAYQYSAGESRGGAVIIEEYLQGQEVSVEIIVLQGVPHVLQVTDKITTGAPHFVEMGHTQPSRLPFDDVQAIKDLACRAVCAIGITNGPAHVEIMLTKNGPKMIELGARMGGDCITTHLVPLSTGVSMIDATLQIACDEVPDIQPKFKKASAIRYLNVPKGEIQSIEGVEDAEILPGVQQVSILKEVGDMVSDIASSGDRVGFVIVQADSAQEAAELCEKAVSLIRISVK